ncbi:MAG: DUF1697 domain-containing protein [Dehalococcoidia bacterium]
MTTYLVLLRGINVGGKNIMPMAELRMCLKEIGFVGVSTYIASGNVLLQSADDVDGVRAAIEDALPKRFRLDNDQIRVHVLTQSQLQAIVDNRPDGFGDRPDLYHSDAIFLMDGDALDVMPVFNPREGVDRVWPGDGVIYSQRLSAERAKSRLGQIAASPFYKSMTIRSWSTTTKLLDLLARSNASSDE